MAHEDRLLLPLGDDGLQLPCREDHHDRGGRDGGDEPPDLYERLVRLRSHGITRDPETMEGESHGPWYYQQIELGFNYRMTDIQAALGASQLRRVDAFVDRRNRLAERYDEDSKIFR